MLGRRIAMTAAVTAVVAAVPQAAHAATIAFAGDVMTYQAAAGEGNNASTELGQGITCSQRAAPCLHVFDAGAPITSFPADKCAENEVGGIECDAPSRIIVRLGDGDDAYTDWSGPSEIHGEGGNETFLRGGGGDDQISGGAGNDALFGGDGSDALDGGDGNDYFEGFGGLSPEDPNTTGGTDAYAGGPGTDFIDYAGRTEALTVTLDGVADDGAPGEADNVGVDVEEVRGGNAGDTLLGNDLANSLDGWDGDDTLVAGAGDDSLFGRTGTDSLAGGSGQDTLEGGAGDDTTDGGADVDTIYGDELQVCIPSACSTGRDKVLARDGSPDKVFCGPGTDEATLDATDTIPDAGAQDACESVDRSAAGGDGGGGGGDGGGGDGGGGGGADAVAPQIGAFKAGKLKRGKTLTLRIELSEAATLTLRAERKVRKKGRTRYKKVKGKLVGEFPAGPSAFVFDGRIAGKRLKRGTYRLKLTATDDAGNKGPARRATLKVR